MNRPTTTPETARNAPSVNSRLSLAVDYLQWAGEEARAEGLYPLADELDRLRNEAVALALHYFRSEGQDPR